MIIFISFLLIFWSIFNSYLLFKKKPTLIKKVYFANLVDYPIAFVMVSFVISIIILISSLNLPNFLFFSWLKLIGENGTNLIISPIKSDYPTSSLHWGPFLFYGIFIFCIPYLANIEEIQFRHYSFSIKDRIWNSIKFGFLHMVVGVPLFAAIVLSIIGWLFSIRYVRKFNSELDKDGLNYIESADVALESSTSLHAKYNFIIITLIFITLLIS